MECADFNVYANCDATTCEIVRRKPGLTLRDWVKAQWKRGVNPRVISPFLSPDYEAKNGLDYFGGELKKAVTA